MTDQPAPKDDNVAAAAVTAPAPANEKPGRLLDVYNEINPQGREVELVTLAGVEVLITGAVFHSRGFLEQVELRFQDADGVRYHVTTDAANVVEKVKIVAKRLPLYATFRVKVEDASGAAYWDLV